MLAKDVKRGEIVRKVFDLGEVKDYSFKDPDTGEMVLRQKFIITSNRRDREKDIVQPSGAIVDDYAKNPVVLWAHQYDEIPLARSIEMELLKQASYDKEGDPTEIHQISALVTYVPDSIYQKNWTGLTGSMVYEMYKQKFLNAVSIGFDPHEWEAIEEKGTDIKTPSDLVDMFEQMNSGTNFLKWDMLEFSFVPVPANPDALVDRGTKKMFMKTLKSWATETIATCDKCAAEGKAVDETAKLEAEEFMKMMDLTEIKGVIPYKQTPKNDTESWDGPAEVAAATTDDLMIMCTWYDSSKPKEKLVKNDFKLPHHTASGHTLIKAGLIGCGNAIQGARGGVQIPEGEVPGVKSHLQKHYHEFDMKAPWEPESGGKSMEETIEKIEGMSQDELLAHVKALYKSGRVLSDANENALRDAVAAHNDGIKQHQIGIKKTNGVLSQVTGQPGEPAQGDSNDQGTETNANAGKAATRTAFKNLAALAVKADKALDPKQLADLKKALSMFGQADVIEAKAEKLEDDAVDLIEGVVGAKGPAAGEETDAEDKKTITLPEGEINVKGSIIVGYPLGQNIVEVKGADYGEDPEETFLVDEDALDEEIETYLDGQGAQSGQGNEQTEA